MLNAGSYVASFCRHDPDIYRLLAFNEQLFMSLLNDSVSLFQACAILGRNSLIFSFSLYVHLDGW